MQNINFGQLVTAIYLNGRQVQGTVYDMNETTVWVENKEDIYPCKIETVVPVTTTKVTPVTTTPIDTNAQVLIDYLNTYGYEYNVDGNDDFDTYSIKGYSYNVYICVYANHFELDTVHRDKAKKSEFRLDYEGGKNNKIIKKSETLVKQITKFLEK